MNVMERQRNIDIQVCLKILIDNENLYAPAAIYFENYYVVFSSRYNRVQFYNCGKSKAMLVLSFDDIFQSFIDPERPTEEEFVMFRLQHGVDWIVEPKGWNL
ncbi:MAG: hypothetical protein EOM41_00955 [Bacilli bacterium]|nr:hypothetical protein [Bacilli bacterium]